MQGRAPTISQVKFEYRKSIRRRQLRTPRYRGSPVSPVGAVNAIAIVAGAEEGTRTPTAFRPPAPKAGASANSATSAVGASVYHRRRRAPLITLAHNTDF